MIIDRGRRIELRARALDPTLPKTGRLLAVARLISAPAWTDSPVWLIHIRYGEGNVLTERCDGTEAARTRLRALSPDPADRNVGAVR